MFKKVTKGLFGIAKFEVICTTMNYIAYENFKQTFF